MKECSIYIDGEFAESVTRERFESIDPYTRAPWATVPRCNQLDVTRAIESAKRAFDDRRWSRCRPSVRGNVLRRIADRLSECVDELALIETSDNGKPIVDTVAQIGSLPEWFRYYAGLAETMVGHVVPADQDRMFCYTQHEPLGVISAITPWNSPLMLACWKLAPALAAGNTVVLKPSELASASTCEFMRIIRDAGVPPGVVNRVSGFPGDLGTGLVTDPRVAKVTFTGSSAVGRQIGTLAAAEIKPVVLELGGKSAQIVCEDARLEPAVAAVVAGLFRSNGQSCVAGSRLLVHRSVAGKFVALLTDAVARLPMGDPRDAGTRIGPIANEAQFLKTLGFIETAKREGATCILGGARSARSGCDDGWFIEPTIFTDVTRDMTIASEEIFGPVLAVMEFEDLDQAVRICNDSRYGLAAGVWTQSTARYHELANRIECGTVYINTYKNVGVAVPAGGYKQSGIGRENGMAGFAEFVHSKSVWLST
jgi:(Z)-2-((N-methylformamido)methylene)-5-hydroxybutyrolactone dehydrogenase